MSEGKTAGQQIVRVDRVLSSRVCILLIVQAWLSGCSVRDAFTAHTDMVAQAAGHELTVERLGQLIAASNQIPLRREVVNRVAGLWVDYALLAHRLAEGDSLLDSATVVVALWSDAQQQTVTHYHEELVANNVTIAESVVDSAYRVGNHRLIQQILVRTSEADNGEEREEKRLKAERLRVLAASGDEGWVRANRENEDSVSKVQGGSLGIIGRGETVSEFEEVAFSLAPGEVSSVVESDYGYHIVRRPELAQVRAEYEGGLRDIFIERMNFKFINEVQDRWEIEVRPGAAELMRKVAEDPARYRKSGKVIGSHLGGDFTMGDFARWLQALPAEYTREVMNSDDDQLSQFANGLMRNDVLEVEARAAGHGLTAEDYAVLQETLSQELARLRTAMRVDSAAAAGSQAARFASVDTAIDNYLSAITKDLAQLVIVPPFLAEKLRDEMEWKINPSGVNRALELGTHMRAALGAGRVASQSDSAPANEEDQ